MAFRDSVTDAAAEAQAARNTAEQVESALTFMEAEVTSLEMYASGNQFRIGDTGVVSDARFGVSLSPEEKLIREGIKRQIEQTVTEVVRSGREIETLAADGLRAIAAGTIDEGRAFHMTEDGDFVNEIFGEVGTAKRGLDNPARQWGLEELSMETTDVVVRTHPETGEPVAHDTRYGRDDYNRIHGEHSIYTKNETVSLHNPAAIAADRLDLLAR